MGRAAKTLLRGWCGTEMGPDGAGPLPATAHYAHSLRAHLMQAGARVCLSGRPELSFSGKEHIVRAQARGTERSTTRGSKRLTDVQMCLMRATS